MEGVLELPDWGENIKNLLVTHRISSQSFTQRRSWSRTPTQCVKYCQVREKNRHEERRTGEQILLRGAPMLFDRWVHHSKHLSTFKSSGRFLFQKESVKNTVDSSLGTLTLMHLGSNRITYTSNPVTLQADSQQMMPLT
jgi:hypothetical protein